MFMIHNTVREENIEYLDVKMYESSTPDEEGLISHSRIFRDETGKMNERVVFKRNI
ncbi:hypothetical protein P4C99_10155 [Pontiellaceae bacterium B1224]|nr:hypothetical protein [Pontiellaceae bacterium B1224]